MRILKPTSLIILISVIVFSVFVSWELVLANLIKAGPAAYTLNVLAIGAGLLLARAGRLETQQTLTVGIEVGVQNATMAMFLTLSVLESLELAVAPTLYGCIMVFNSFLLIGLLRHSAARAAKAQATH